jgi:hypothetical protein
MRLVILLGVAVAVVGVALDSGLAVTVGATLALLSALGFLVPGFRDVRPPQRVDRESYIGFVLNVFRTTPSASVSHHRADRTTSPPQSPEVPSAPDRTRDPRP